MIPAAFARLFGRPEGSEVIAWLKHRTMERVLMPDATDAELRFLEGQRALVNQILNLIQQGQQERK